MSPTVEVIYLHIEQKSIDLKFLIPLTFCLICTEYKICSTFEEDQMTAAKNREVTHKFYFAEFM